MNNNSDVGTELLFLLRQQRYLYHQLKSLTHTQQQLAGSQSPESILEIIAGRQKLVEKLNQLEDRLRPVKAGWDSVLRSISDEHKNQAKKMADEVCQIITQIRQIAPPQTYEGLGLDDHLQFNSLLAQTEP